MNCESCDFDLCGKCAKMDIEEKRVPDSSENERIAQGGLEAATAWTRSCAEFPNGALR
jgi:hypothetical protein